MSKMYSFVFLTLCLIGHMEAKCLANLATSEMMATSTIESSIVTESTTLSNDQRATSEMTTTTAIESSIVTESTTLSNFPRVAEKMCAISPKCQDLSKVQDPMTIENVDGCAVLVCPENKLPYILGSYEGSELPKVDGEKDFRIRPPLSMADLGGGTINDYFGLTCENNMLTASKYPHGIHPGLKNETMGVDGSLNGKKGVLIYINCT